MILNNLFIQNIDIESVVLQFNNLQCTKKIVQIFLSSKACKRLSIYWVERPPISTFYRVMASCTLSEETAYSTVYHHLSKCWAVFIQLDCMLRWWYTVEWAVSSESVGIDKLDYSRAIFGVTQPTPSLSSIFFLWARKDEFCWCFLCSHIFRRLRSSQSPIVSIQVAQIFCSCCCLFIFLPVHILACLLEQAFTLWYICKVNLVIPFQMHHAVSDVVLQQVAHV